MKKNRTDRILIIITLAILMMASGLFYFDNWMWGNRRDRGERIGVISIKSGDVRVKYAGDLKWQKSSSGQDLIYDDSIYAGSDSQAKLQLGESELTVSENSLVVLRREDRSSFLNLSYGSLFGKIAPGEKIMVDTGDGKPIEVSSKNNAQVVIKKQQNGKTSVDVISGEANLNVNGRRTTITKANHVTLDARAANPTVETITLQAVKPLRDEVLYSEDAGRIDFAWKWSSGRKPNPGELYTVEFSSSPAFSNLQSKRQVQGQLATSLNASESVSLFYRVKGPHGETSPVEKANFVRMHKPLIVSPVAMQKFDAPETQNALIGFEFRKPSTANVWFQIANDNEFKVVLTEETTASEKRVRELPVGQYFLRAKADYGQGHVSSWTDTVPFTIEQKVKVLPLTQTTDHGRVLIPNRNYPAELYQSAPGRVKGYLSGKGLLANFFQGEFDDLQIAFDQGNSKDAQILTQHSTAWPSEKLAPGAYRYKYQTSRSGFAPTPWSPAKKLEIAMEPPRPVGDTQYGPADKKGVSEAQWKFTPLLFAKTYDVEVSRDPYMRNASASSVDVPEVKAPLQAGDNYWRVRARDRNGRIISDFSSIYKHQAPVPVFLAKNPPAENRKPAATEATKMKVERIHEEAFSKNGWWVWAGVGEDYIDYKESDQAIGSFDTHHINGPSEYLEMGFIGNSNWGGVMTFKSTPGTVQISNAEVDNTSYNWSTIGAEAILRKRSEFTIFDTPLTYGLRAGIQQHNMPFGYVDGNNAIELKNATMTDASIGVLAEWTRRRWTYYWLMRYQYPLMAKADGSTSFSVSPIFAFDGSIGTSYNLTRQLKAGLFWYGQWHQFHFNYVNEPYSDTGQQSMFYSNIDLRLGWDF